ncbi:calcium uptake 1 mitochondrial isoform X2 [Brachionus plicatilis]|uniref:Calcium uptake 1 mitochondrial isoform X2 n=1 Tax=Brachionus plicatilis TaxID=10195 RepID=A0A3M7RNB6_BRAPC|nr:calcium uptake 1 mitochondrial isoform X2 [Brachionus plicatilis]
MNVKFLINTNLMKRKYLFGTIRPSSVLLVTLPTNSIKSNIIKNPLLIPFKVYENLLAVNFSTNQKQYTIRGGPGYTKFGHGRYKQQISKYAYFWYAFIVGSMTFLTFFDFENFSLRGQEPEQKMKDMKRLYSKIDIPRAKEIEGSEVDISDSDKNESQVDEKKSKQSFRDRKIIQYENKIRHYSTPDKVFRYFATLKIWNEKLNDYEVFMKPDDLIRSLTYGVKQPEGLGLDSYQRFDPNMQKLDLNLDEESAFRHLGNHGLISFSDYIFLITLLSIPVRHFVIAFHMFDSDGNGNLDIQEFEQLQMIIRSQTSLGQRHRDTRMTGNIIRENSALNEYFFGKDLSAYLTAKKFTDFQKKLQDEVFKMEFDFCERKEKNGEQVISELTFCEMILAYAGFSAGKTKKMLKRIEKIYDEENSAGITLHDFQEFFKVLRCIDDIDTALKFYTIAGASIDKMVLKHVSKTVANSMLSDHVIDVIFNLFDENGDSRLSNKEFIKVMKKRWTRGLETPKDTGFVKLIEAIGECGKDLLF